MRCPKGSVPELDPLTDSRYEDSRFRIFGVHIQNSPEKFGDKDASLGIGLDLITIAGEPAQEVLVGAAFTHFVLQSLICGLEAFLPPQT